MCGQSVVSQHAIHDNKSPLCLCCTADGFQHQGNKLSFVDVRLISLVPMLFYIVSNGRLPNVFCQNKYFLHALLLNEFLLIIAKYLRSVDLIRCKTNCKDLIWCIILLILNVDKSETVYPNLLVY